MVNLATYRVLHSLYKNTIYKQGIIVKMNYLKDHLQHQNTEYRGHCKIYKPHNRSTNELKEMGNLTEITYIGWVF